MAVIIKCKMCGGELALVEGSSIATCEYCGTTQTVPSQDNEKKLTLFARANRLRAACEFDKAAGIYEAIVADFPEEAEAYWGLVLCRYGIEYVDDPATGKKIPTCHRTSFESVLEDDDFQQSVENAAAAARKVYREEAKQIEEIRKGIIAVSANEQPYDIFICYKETAENGDRTLDSVLAQDVYDALTDKGYRVFFSRITLEDKLGVEYEPYIFAALNSAKIMLVIGTEYDYFNAVWVKNEWSRYLKLMAKDKSKHLIPCYKDIDAYDMPKEFAKLQAQDLGKVGAIQDLLRGVEKLLGVQKAPAAAVAVGSDNIVAETLQKAYDFLRVQDWESAGYTLDTVRGYEPDNLSMLIGKLMLDCRVTKEEQLAQFDGRLDANPNYTQAIRVADSDTKARLEKYNKATIYGLAISRGKDNTLKSVQQALSLLGEIRGYEDADSKTLQLQDALKKLQAKKKKGTVLAATAVAMVVLAAAFLTFKKLYLDPLWAYNDAVAMMEAGKYEEAISAFEALGSYQDSAAKIEEVKYSKALALKNAGKYEEAISAFEALGDYKDSRNQIEACNTAIRTALLDSKYNSALALKNAGKYEEAISAFDALAGYKDSQNQIEACNAAILDGKYSSALALKNAGKYPEAAIAFAGIETYKDAKTQAKTLWDQIAVRDSISTAGYITVGLKTDGTVAAVVTQTIGQHDVSGWTNIVAISTGGAHTVGLKSDGTVVATGSQSSGRCDVEDWTDIVAISAGGAHTVGLKSDGTVVAVGRNDDGQCNVEDWTDIIAISAGIYHNVGLKADGTVVAVGKNDDGECDVSNWTDIVAISAGFNYTVGLKTDGTVVAVGLNQYGQCNVEDWTDIVAISASAYTYHTVGLKADGTVVAVGLNSTLGINYKGECDVSGWRNIVAISAGRFNTVGLKADGTVATVGQSYEGEWDMVSDWKNIKLPNGNY